jgi:phosphatidate cytidylyltransferase
MAAEGSSGPGLRRGWLATELGARVASGVVLAGAVLFATYQGGLLFALVWLAAGLAVLGEWIAMARLEGRWRLQLVLSVGLVALLGAYLAPVSLAAGAALFVLGLALAFLLGATWRDRLWAAAALACAAILVLVPPAVRDHPGLGLVGVLWMFAVVWTTDIAAYFAGRALGGPKLWPRVSPKKTWSGFAGGFLAATLAGVAVAWTAARSGWTPPFGLAAVGLLSAFASVLSQGGDLAESALKRRFGVKDSGRLIPGHGGVMDRLDGFWAVAALVGLILVIERSGRPDVLPA